MTRLVCLLGLLLMASPVLAFDLQSLFQTLPEGDAALINQQESELFGRILCQDDAISPWESCQFSIESFGPFLNYNNDPGFLPLSVLYGNFTQIGAQEVIVGLALEGTDSGAMSQALLYRDGAEWRPLQFTEDALLQSYLIFPAHDGRTLLVARQDRLPIGGRFESYMSGFTLQMVDIAGGEIAASLLLDFVNPLLSCTYPPASGARYMEIIDWKRRDVNEDDTWTWCSK